VFDSLASKVNNSTRLLNIQTLKHSLNRPLANTKTAFSIAAVLVCLLSLIFGFAIAASSLKEDYDSNGVVDAYDLNLFIDKYVAHNLAADLNGDGKTDSADIDALISDFRQEASTSCTVNIGATASLQTAINNAHAGDVLCLAASTTYAGNIDLHNTNGTSAQPITITSQDQTRPATVKGRIVAWPGANYITLSWLKLDGINNGNLPSPTIGSDHISLLHNDITNEYTAICIDDIADPTYGTAHYTMIDHNRIHACGLIPATNYDHGVYESGYNATITNNYIYDNSDRGIQLRGAQNATVEHNIVDGNGEGIIFGDLTSSNNVVRNNIFSNSRVRFNVESNWVGTPVGTGNAFTNNCVWSTVSGYYGTNSGIQPDLSGVTVSGTVAANPLFVNATLGNYTLQSGSPCAAMAPQ
jgi:parallel beta-helix repeat protein